MMKIYLIMSKEEKMYHENCWECYICNEHIHDVTPVYTYGDDDDDNNKYPPSKKY